MEQNTISVTLPLYRMYKAKTQLSGTWARMILFLVLMTFWAAANAQYFHHSYGKYVQETVTGTATTALTKVGHIAAGADYGATFGSGATISVVKTNPNGRFTTTFDFRNEYSLVDNLGSQLNAYTPEVIESSAGGAYCLAGAYYNTNTGRHGVYYVELNLLGNVTKAYNFPSSQIVSVRSLKESVLNPGQFYVVGQTVENGYTNANSYILKFDNVGTYLWDWSYDVGLGLPDEATDMVEDVRTGQGLLIGNIEYGYTDAYAFYFNVNGSTVAPNAYIFGTQPTMESFSRIKASNAFAGFVIVGATNNGSTFTGQDQTWLLTLFSGSLAVNWSRTYPGGTNIATYGYDVIERLNTSSHYEYYIAGMIDYGVNLNMLMMKVDGSGSWGPGRMVSYGTNATELACRIAQNNSGTANGVSLYGFTHGFDGTSTANEIGIVKAYFNGESGCDEIIYDPYIGVGPGLNTIQNILQSIQLFSPKINLTATIVKQLVHVEECFNTTLPNGNNAFTIKTPKQQPMAEHVDVSTLENAAGLASVGIALNTGEAQNVTVKIYDALGRIFYSGQVKLSPGQNTLPDSGLMNEMNAGMYSIDISGKDIQFVSMVLVR